MTMGKTKTFEEFITETTFSVNEDELLEAIAQSYTEELTPEKEAQIDEAIDKFVKCYLEEGRSISDLQEEIMNEGLIGSILGGLTGFALGKSVGKLIARVLGIEKGVFYDLLTSRLVGAALGASLGKRI